MVWQAVVEQASGLGESPFWHPAEACLYWCDIAAKQVCRLDQFGFHLLDAVLVLRGERIAAEAVAERGLRDRRA